MDNVKSKKQIKTVSESIDSASTEFSLVYAYRRG